MRPGAMSCNLVRVILVAVVATVLAILPLPPSVPAAAVAAEEGTCQAPPVVEVPRPTPDPDVDTGGWSEDDGNGSFALCLAGEQPRTGAATCTWSGDRSALLHIHTDRVHVGRDLVDADLTAAVSLGVDTPSDMQLWIDAGTKRSYQATADRIVSIERPTDGAIEATFRASRWGHPGAPGLAGTIAVRCGEPPPLGADRTVGRLTFQVGHDGPVYQTGAVCEWVLMDLQATVSRVDALRNRVRMGADQFGATDIEMTSGQGRSLTASLYVGSRFDFNGTEYHDNRTAFPLWAAEDGHAGLLRVLRMLPGEWDSDASLLSDTPGLNMLMSWDCGSPPDPIGTQLTYTEIHGRPGLVTVHLPGMPLAGQVVAASCTAREDEHGWTHPGGVAASFRWGGRDALLVTGSDGFVGLFLREADGSYSGEYSSANPGPGQTWGDGDDGHIDFPATTLTRTWPASDTATAGPTLPATLTISMEWDCQPGLGPLK